MVESWHNNGSYYIMLEKFPIVKWIPFLMIWLMKLLMIFGISGETAGISLAITMGSLMPLISYAIAIVICERKEIALGVALLTALHPNLIEMSIQILREIPYLFFTGIAIWSMLSAIKYHKWWYWGLGGIMLAMAALTRYESLELLLLGLGYLILAPFLKWEKWRNTGMYLSCFIVSFLIGIFFIYWAAGISSCDHFQHCFDRINCTYIKMFKHNLISHD